MTMDIHILLGDHIINVEIVYFHGRVQLMYVIFTNQSV